MRVVGLSREYASHWETCSRLDPNSWFLKAKLLPRNQPRLNNTCQTFARPTNGIGPRPPLTPRAAAVTSPGFTQLKQSKSISIEHACFTRPQAYAAPSASRCTSADHCTQPVMPWPVPACNYPVCMIA